MDWRAEIPSDRADFVYLGSSRLLMLEQPCHERAR